MESIHQARRRLNRAGIDFQSDGSTGFDIYRDKQRIGRVYSEAALISWREEQPIAVVGVPMMDQAEARSTVDAIKGHLDSARKLLLDLEEREGWRALGYSSWRECAQAEFGQSQAYLYRQLAAAKIERDLDSPIGEMPESHARALTQAAPADRERALDRATELAGDQPRTAKHVQAAVTEIAPPRLSEEEYQFAREARKLLKGPIEPQVIEDARKCLRRIRGGALRIALAAEIEHAEQSMQQAIIEERRTENGEAAEDDEPTPASDSAAYKIIEQQDRRWLEDAEMAIAGGTFAYARQLLGGVQVLTYTRDTMLDRIVAQERATIEAQITMPAEVVPAEVACWWNCGVPLRAIEHAVNHHDRAGALAAARELVRLFEG